MENIDEMSAEELREILKIKDIKLEELEKKTQDIVNKLEKISENRVHLSEIFNGVPKIDFIRINESETAAKSKRHESSHEEIKNLISFKVKPSKIKIDFDKIPNPFSILFDNYHIYKNRQVKYGSENTINSLTQLFLSDIFKIMNLSKFLDCYDTISVNTIISKEESKINVPDLIIIKTRHNFPIIVVEGKIPNKEGDSILDNKKVIGQVYDYMISIRAFFNAKEIFGILTTLEEWKFLKLPEEEDLDFKKREVMETKIYNLSDKRLVKTIISIINHSLLSENYPISVFDLKRSYIEYKEKKWRWKIFNEKKLDSLTKKINLNIYKEYKIKNYNIIKYFPDGKDTQTSLCITNHGSLGVIKQYFGEDIKFFKKEAKMWKKIYDLNLEITTLCSCPSLILPLIFTANSREKKFFEKEKEYYKTEVYFQLDLKKLFTTTGAIPGNLSPELKKIQYNIEKVYEGEKVYDCAVTAIKDFAQKGYYHDDFEWRHVGLKPILDKNGEIIELKPILIDLEYVVKKSQEKAEKIMMDKLEKISKNCIFIKDIFMS